MLADPGFLVVVRKHVELIRQHPAPIHLSGPDYSVRVHSNGRIEVHCPDFRAWAKPTVELRAYATTHEPFGAASAEIEIAQTPIVFRLFQFAMATIQFRSGMIVEVIGPGWQRLMGDRFVVDRHEITTVEEAN